ncbi:MAG: hypothetical protein AAGA75_00470 [Cyanobacteria bacterium P01_E01_bin.6]
MNNSPNDSPPPQEETVHAAFDAKLRALEHTSRRTAKTFSLKGFVRQHYESLSSAHFKGHTWNALAELIQSELSVTIAPETLRKYMAAIRNERGEAKAEFIKSTRPNISARHEERSFPLPKNLQPAIDREFRRTPRRN